MLLDQILGLAANHWPTLLVTAVLIQLARNKYQRGLARYPGPWLAAYTDWWRFFLVLGRRPERTYIDLHARHGDVVRLGPNVLSFADPAAIKAIYGLNLGFVKSSFYPAMSAVAKGRPLASLFSTTDETYHAKYRRCVNSYFSMSSLVSYEPLVNSTLEFFLDQTDRFYADTGRPCDMGVWLQFFAFDVIGELTWSKRLGFVEQNADIDGIIQKVTEFQAYAAPAGQYPILDHLWDKNPIKLFLARHGIPAGGGNPVVQFALARQGERSKEMAEIKAHGLPDSMPSNSKGVDLLSKFTAAAHDHPEFMTDSQILASANSMIFAGSDTTSIGLSSIFYFLLKNPATLAKLRAELTAAAASGLIAARPSAVVSWAEAQQLPYLDAVIQEAFRLHPPVGLLLERVVPAGGVVIAGRPVAGGTVVGVNAWVLHRSTAIFGADVEAFRPERWLEADPAQLKGMRATMLHFGAGSRTCIGKNISLLEVYKFVPSFLRRFDITFEDASKDWTTRNTFFVKQHGFRTMVKSRPAPSMYV